MPSLIDIKSSINQLLKTNFKYKIYGSEVQEGFDRPSFFVELIPLRTDYETQNFISKKITVTITYFQKAYQDRAYSNADNYKMHDSLIKLFGISFPVKERFLKPQNIRSEFIDTNKDILQFNFDLEYFDGTGRQRNTEPAVTEVKISSDLFKGGN